MSSTRDTPIFVRDVKSFEPIRIMLCGDPFDCPSAEYQVPPGKRLIVEYVSGHSVMDQPDRANSFLTVVLPGTPTSTGRFGPALLIPTYAVGSSASIGGQKVWFHLDENEIARFPGGSSDYVFLEGYLVDK